ncbi:MAG: MFS transporter [Rhodospirillales bacterium]|nr:MFS transporter [Rhodospirillales bacterium]
MWRQVLRGRNGRLTATACLGEAIYALNVFLVSTATPSVVHDLGGVRFIAWINTLYLVAAIVVGVAAGFLKQKLGTRRVMLLAAACFAAGSLAAAAAPVIAVVLLGRTLQGAGEGAIAACAYALLAEHLPITLIPKAMGAMAMVWAAGALAGPLTSGLLTELVSWRAALLLNLPLIATFAIFVLRSVPERDTAAASERLPATRLALLAAGIMLVAVAAVATSVAWWLVGVGLIMLTGTTVVDRRATVRLFPHDAFRPSTRFGKVHWIALLMPLGQASTSVYLPITVQNLWGYRPIVTGVIVATMALSWSASALLITLPQDISAVRAIRGGATLTAARLAIATLAIPGRALLPLLAAQVVIGTGFGLSWGWINQVGVDAAPQGERDLAAALLPTTQNAGYALGAALAGLIANASGYARELADGTGHGGVTVFATGTAVAVLAAFASFRLKA